MNKWFKIISLSLFLLIMLLSINELLLIKAGHLKSITSDDDLWSIEREKVSKLNKEDIILIGASRMQVDVDLECLKKSFPNREILQLALSGRGSSYPVYKDLITDSGFTGIIIISETPDRLVNLESKQKDAVANFKTFSLDNKVNKKISMWFEKTFLFSNPNSNSERLWGNLLVEGNLPEPMFTVTYDTREQTSFFNIVESNWIYKNNMQSVNKRVGKTPLPFNDLKTSLNPWRNLISTFEKKGGKTIFIRMPISNERWELENKWMPKSEYWYKMMNYFNVDSIHFSDYSELSNFDLPDSSHLNAMSKREFTQNFVHILKKKV